MQHVKIEIQSSEEASKGHKVFTDVVSDGQPVLQGTVTNMACLENGQESGKTSVMLHVEDQRGESVIVQITQDNFLGMAAALQGAIQRFGK